MNSHTYYLLRLNYIVLVLFCCVTHLHGQSTLSDTMSKSVWGQINSYEGKLIIEKTRGGELNENSKVTINWKEDKQEHFVTHFVKSQYDRQALDLSESYDGSVYTLLDKSGSATLCKVSKTLPDVVKSFEYGIYPLEPFRFFTKTVSQNNTVRINLKDLAVGLESKMSGLSKLPLQEASFANTPALSFDVDGGQNVDHGYPIKYKVYVSKDSHDLIGWECLTLDGKISSQLFVNSWKTITLGGVNLPLRYPSGFTIIYYPDPTKSSSSTPAFEYRASLDLTKIAPDTDLSSFTLDPAEADYIYDLDNKVLIKNPR